MLKGVTRNLFVVLIMLFIFAASVYSQGAYLQLSLFDDGDFTITFDDMKLSEGNYAEFDNIQPGEHYLRVVKIGINVPAQENVIFDGKIKIPAGDIYAVIDEYNAFMVYKKKSYGYNRNIPSGSFSRKCGGDGSSSNNNNNNNNNQNVADECRGKLMTKEDYKDLKTSIGNRNFESTNVTLLKSAIDNNYFTSEQIREMMVYFTFEDSKLEVAKYSYKKVCDKNNFFKVYDAFSFDSSVNELKDYISGK